MLSFFLKKTHLCFAILLSLAFSIYADEVPIPSNLSNEFISDNTVTTTALFNNIFMDKDKIGSDTTDICFNLDKSKIIITAHNQTYSIGTANNIYTNENISKNVISLRASNDTPRIKLNVKGNTNLSDGFIELGLPPPNKNAIIAFNGEQPQIIDADIIKSYWLPSYSEILVANPNNKVIFNRYIGDTKSSLVSEIDRAKFAIDKLTVANNSQIEINKANNQINLLSLGNNAKMYLGRNIVAGDTIIKGKIAVGSNNQDIAYLYLAPSLIAGDAITLATDSSNAQLVKNSQQNIAKLGFGNLELKDTLLYDYSFEIKDNKIFIKTTNKTISSSSTDLHVSPQVIIAARQAEHAIDNLQNPTLQAKLHAKLDNAILAGGSSATNIVEQLSVQSDMLSSTPTASLQTGAAIFDVTSARLATNRASPQFSGVSTGDMQSHNGLWLRSFGNWSNLETIGDSFGYDAFTYGFIAGADKFIFDDIQLGTAFTYSLTDVDGEGAGNFQNNIDTYQLTLYADYTNNNYYLETMLGYAISKNSANYLSLGSTISADYDAKQWMARLAGGMPFAIGNNIYLTPNASLSYAHLTTDPYNEHGDLAKYIAIDSVNSLYGVFDAKLHTNYAFADNSSMLAYIHAGVSYEFADNHVSSTSNFIGETTPFTAESADIDPLCGLFGLGIDYQNNQWTFSSQYDGSLNADTASHSLSIQARFDF